MYDVKDVGNDESVYIEEQLDNHELTATWASVGCFSTIGCFPTTYSTAACGGTGSTFS